MIKLKKVLLLINILLINTSVLADPLPFKNNIDEIFNIGYMVSHDKNFTLFFKTRSKSVLAKGEDFNYITDYPQDLYFFENKSKKIKPLITYDWFPKKVKSYILNYNLPIFPEDFAYYLLNDNRTLIMISGIKAINQNFKYDLVTNKLDKYSSKNNLDFLISSIAKKCGYKSMNNIYECKYYKPLISKNLIN
jgi:hypothetical protein|tara:strand:+ start:59 stop:634 length:576 start_codon:yes stop_codon:yes gene_type:complete